MNYAQFQQQISILAEQAISPAYALTDVPDFANTIPSVIAYAEGRIYRACVFLATRTQNSQLNFTPASRTLDLSPISPSLLVVEGVAAITPVTAMTPAAGTRNPFDMSSLDLIDLAWPTESVTKDPSDATYRQAAMKDEKTIVVMPTPDDAYVAEITGLFQPAPLSATNTTTYLSTVYPDLMLAASMIFVSAFLRDFGAQSDDPKVANSWESQFNNLVQTTVLEEQRRRTQGTGWSPNMATPLATPPRT